VTKTLERFKNRFAGLSRAFGQYRVVTEEKSGKKTGPRSTVKRTLSDAVWTRHLEGKVGLGVVPIRDDGSVVFGAIDVDVYDLDIAAEEAKVNSLGLPLVVCRTKSGGAHLYLFLTGPAKASLVRKKLSDWSSALGRAGAEIFPKQDALRDVDDVGSWINLPYFAGDRTTRYAVANGSSKTLAEFLDLADDKAVDPAALSGIDATFKDDLPGAPPCLQALLAAGVSEGNRNEILFVLGVYVKKSGGDLEQDLQAWNERYLDPPLSDSEVATVIRSIGNKDYAYPCKRPFMASLCNKTLCLRREFGVGSESADPGILIENLRKIQTDPPSWVVDVNDQKIRLDSSEDLVTQARFNVIVMERMNVLPRRLKPHLWEALVQRLLAGVKEIEAPPDAGRTGQFMNLVDYFLTERPKARSKEELLLGKCWAENGTTFFRSSDLLKFLDVSKFKATPKESWNMLRIHGADAIRFKVKGKVVRCWSMPADSRETEIEPREPEDEEF
jgi:hypothetical protein